MIGGDGLATRIRSSAADAAQRAIEEFAAAAILAFGDAAMTLVRDHAAIGADALAETLVTAYGTDLLGRIVTDVDDKGIDVGDVHVTTNLAKFASGDPAARTPIADVCAEHAFPIVLASAGPFEATGTITLKATCGLDETTHELKTTPAVKIELALAWSSENDKQDATANA
jgi:hypothetical protein